MEENIKSIEEEPKEEINEEKIVLPDWSIDVPLEINRGEK